MSSKSPVYIGAGSGELAVTSALNIIDGANDVSLKLQTVEEWVTLTDGTTVFDFVNNAQTNEYSAKEYAQGIAATGGTAKQWALGGGSHVEATEVITGEYSAKKYASNAAASAALAEGYTDAFDDKYLGSHTTASREVGANVGKDNDGDALDDGALYYDTTLEVMKVWDDTASAWKQTTPTSGQQTNIDAAVADAVDIGKVAAIDTEIGQLAVLGTAGVDITTVSNIGTDGADVSTVAGITAGDVSKVAVITTGDVSKVAVITTGDVSKVADITTGDVSKVADITTGDVSKVAVITTGDVSKVAVITTGDVSKVADITTGDVSKVAVITTGDVSKVAAITTGDVSKVAVITTGDVSKVAAITTGDVTKVASITTGDVTKVADVDGEVALVAAVDGEITLLGTSNMAHATTGHLARLGTATVTEDMALLGLAPVIADMDLLGATGVIGDIETVADNISSVNDFADRYRIASSAPGSDNDEGDLYYNTTTNKLSFYDASAWQAFGLTLTETQLEANNSAVAMSIALG